MKRIGFYGGSFNPPHAGHQATILHAITTGNLDELRVVPVYKHPYGKILVDYYQRIEMCRFLQSPFEDSYCPMYVSHVEKFAWEDDGGTGLTSQAVHKLIDIEYKTTGTRPHVVLILGSDCQKDLPTWEGYDQLLELCKRGFLSFFFVARISGISSTAIRNMIKVGAAVDRWLPREIHKYVFNNQLYR